MRAVVLEAFGGAENLRYVKDFPDPVLKPSRVLVRVKAVALNHLDIWVREGVLAVKPELPHIIGSDVSGVVEEVGEGVEGLQKGDEVIIAPGLSCGRCYECLRGDQNHCRDYDILGMRSKGGYAEYVAVPYRNVIKKPKNLTFEQASSYPLTFLTMWNALVRKGGVNPEKKVFIWAGSSGVGVAGIQIAKLFGAYVITTAGTEEKMEMCMSLGADMVINHYKEDVVAKVRELFREGVDLVVDHVGEKTFDRSIHLLKKGGKLLFFGTTTGSRAVIDIRYLFVREIALRGVYMGSNADLYPITRLFEEGKLKPVVDRVFPLSHAEEAHRYLEGSKHFGKVVLMVE